MRGLWLLEHFQAEAHAGERLEHRQALERAYAADPDDDIWTKAPDLPTKRCAWVAKGEPLFGACLFAVTDPIDTLTVVWEAPKDKKSQKMGVALTTRNVSMAAGYERANARCDSSNSPFARCRWRTNGGGRGWMQSEMSMGLHFGEASLQVVHRDFSRMREDTGDCRLRDCPIKPQSTELVPIYSHTADEKLTADHLCAVHLRPRSPRSRTCVRLRHPTPTKQREPRTVLSTLAAHAGRQRRTRSCYGCCPCSRCLRRATGRR